MSIDFQASLSIKLRRGIAFTGILAAGLACAQPADLAIEPADELDTTDIFARDTFRIDTFVCPFKSNIEYEPGDIECGLLQVPENRENPDSRFIELHFVKLNATWDDDEEADNDDDENDSGIAPGRRDDAVIYLSGGPGAHAVNYVERFKDHRLVKHRDMYILEQRGVGYSADFCPNYTARSPENFDVGNFEEQQEASLIASNDCAQNAMAAGVDVSGYNTTENARDVQALRLALGIDQWNVFGISYGTILGQAYIKQDPEGIRSIVLDSIVPIFARTEPEHWRMVTWYDRDLEKLDALCQAQPSCAKRYPDLGKRVREAASSVVDDPISVEVKDVELYPSGKAYVFQDIAAFLPFVLFYEQDNYPGLPAVIYEWADIVESRDETFFKVIAQGGDDGFGGISRGMYDAIFCLDGYRDAQISSGAQDREEFPVLGGVMGTEANDRRRADSCIELGLAPRDPLDQAPVDTDIPALIVAGDMDPITPPPLAKAILPGFSNATYVEFPYTGHGPLRSMECGGDLLNKFFDDPTADPDLGCIDEAEVPEFHAPLFATRVATRIGLLAVEDKEKLAGPAAWAGASVLVSLIAFVFLSVAPIGRRIDKRQAVATDGARWAAWLSASLSTAAVVVLGAATAVTIDQSEILAVFGLVPWARYGAVAGLLAGILGIATIVLTVRARSQRKLPIGTLLGFLLTGLAALGLSSFLLAWDLGPF